MPQFIHIADEKDAASIKRSGIKIFPAWSTKGVFATPVLQNYVVAHQWVRELKRRGMKTVVAVQFLIPAREKVLVGRYNEKPLETTASGAIKIFREHSNGLGLQVVIPRKILPDEIRRIYTPSQIAGWRYFPGSHGKKPCGCDYCAGGQIKGRKRRDAYEEWDNRDPGYMPKANRCPCCRYYTLNQRGVSEQCEICYWIDNGQDDADAEEVRPGENDDISLRQARLNFRKSRINRKFLQVLRKPAPL